MLQQNTIAGIYCITSPTNKKYIGQSWNLLKRFGDYRSLNCKRQVGIFNSLKKHGVQNHTFEILVSYHGDKDGVLDLLELLNWHKLKQEGFKMLNVREPSGSHGKHSEESKMKMSRSRKGKYAGENSYWFGVKGVDNPNFGAKRSEETKWKISLSKQGEKHHMYNKTHTDDAKEKIGAASKGNKYAVGYRHTDEAKRKISEAAKGKTFTSFDRIGEKHPMSKLTEFDVVKIWNMLKDGKQATEISKVFGVGRCAIQSIKDKRNWNHITKHLA
jgi:group I intron endonuclease